MLKVCHLTVNHEATDVRVFEKECKSLVKAGYEVYLIAPNAETGIVGGVQVIGLPLKSRNPLYRLFVASRKSFYKALEIDAEIYHFHDVELFNIGLKLKRRGKKVIFDSHENWIGYVDKIKFLPDFLKGVVASYLKRLYTKYLKCFDAVITVSPHIVDILKEYTSKVYMVTNYPILLEKEALDVFDEEEYVRRENCICYSGTVYKESNQECILEAIESVSDLRYLIVGTLSSDYHQSLSSYPGWEKVSFIKKVPLDELRGIYKKVLAGLVVFDYTPNLGYRRGTLGSNKMFEYMMYGLPIIASNQELWEHEIVDKYKCGICVEPRNVEQIRDAMSQIVNNKVESFQMGQRAREAVFKEFNWVTQEKILLEVYKSVLQN